MVHGAPEDQLTGASSDTTFVHKGFRVAARLTQTHVLWKTSGKNRLLQAATSFSEKLAYDEILSARHVTTTPCSCLGECSCLQVHQLLIFSFSRSHKKPWQWRQQEYCLGSPQLDVVRDWAIKINAAVQRNLERPGNLLVYLNPQSGRGAARSVWEKILQPLFRRAHIKCTVVDTTHKDHARDMVAGMKFDELVGYQGLVAVGGDGLFQEVLAGLLARRAAAAGQEATFLQRLRIAHIPAGSTDAVACTLHGCRSPETAALHVALGDRTALDVMRLQAKAGNHCFSVCQAGYGFMGDVMQHSEGLRWMGPVRYDVSGALQFASLRSYPATVSFLPAALPIHSDRSATCGHRCSVCAAAALTSRPPGSQYFPPPPIPADADSSSSSSSSGEDGLGGEEGWERRAGEFVSIMCVVTPCRSDKTPSGVVPMGHLADGSIYLVLVQRCSRLQYLQFLLALSGGGVAPGQFAWVEVVAVTALRVLPEEGGPLSRWNVDGELVEGGEVHAQVCRGLVDVFGRGLESPSPERCTA